MPSLVRIKFYIRPPLSLVVLFSYAPPLILLGSVGRFSELFDKKNQQRTVAFTFFTALDPSEGDANLNNVSVFLVFKCG